MKNINICDKQRERNCMNQSIGCWEWITSFYIGELDAAKKLANREENIAASRILLHEQAKVVFFFHDINWRFFVIEQCLFSCCDTFSTSSESKRDFSVILHHARALVEPSSSSLFNSSLSLARARKVNPTFWHCVQRDCSGWRWQCYTILVLCT